MGKKKGLGISSLIGFIKPADVLIALVYAGLFGLFLSISVQNLGAAGSVFIQSSEGEFRYSFEEELQLDFTGPVGDTRIEVDPFGRTRVVSSDCRDQICVNHGWLESGGEWAACLPNRVFVRVDRAAVEQNSEAEIDATAF